MEIKENRTMTAEEILNDPTLSELHAIVRFQQANPNHIFFPEKYFAGLVEVVGLKTVELHKSNPENTLLQVVTTVLGSLNPHIPDYMIVKVVPVIIKVWRRQQSNAALKKQDQARLVMYSTINGLHKEAETNGLTDELIEELLADES